MVVVRQLFLMIRQATIIIQAFTRGTLARHRYRLVSIQQPYHLDYTIKNNLSLPISNVL